MFIFNLCTHKNRTVADISPPVLDQHDQTCKMNGGPGKGLHGGRWRKFPTIVQKVISTAGRTEIYSPNKKQ